MKYLCVHCDKTFEHDDDSPKKARCPECLRVNGLEEVAAPEEGERQSAPWRWWAVAGGALVAAGIGYAFWASQAPDTVSGDAPLAPLDRAAVVGHLRNQNVDARQLGTMLVPSEQIERWAEQVAGDASTPRAQAEAIQEAIRERAAAGAFEPWSFGVPRQTPITTPAQVIEWLSEDGAQHHLYPIEVAATMTAALRALDAQAMVAEAVRFEGERRPPDPSGQLGYYVVAVYDTAPSREAEPAYFDPYQGREVPPEEARVLTDLEAVGAALSHRALHLLSRESDPQRAMESSSHALRLDGRSPSSRAVRGAILLVAGQPDEGLRELQSARQLRSDAPRRNLLAGVHLAQGDLEAASREVAAALEEYPEFAPGRATLAAIHLSRGEPDLARTELEAAERVDPQLHVLSQLWAGYYAATGDMDRAVERAQQAVERNPDIQTRLMAARIFRQASRYTLMRRQAHAVMDNTPPQQQAQMRELIRQMLGPTALEPVEDDEALAAADEGVDDLELGGTGSLQLDSALLNEDDGPSLGGGGGPSLLGDDEGGGGLQLGGGGGGLQLGGGGGGLGSGGLGGGSGGGYQLRLGD